MPLVFPLTADYKKYTLIAALKIALNSESLYLSAIIHNTLFT